MAFSDVADFYHLRVFLEVAEQHSFSRAAERLYVSQPTVSNLIKRLEKGMAEPLFRRGKRQVTLTDAGELLYGHARKLITHADLLDVSVEGIAGAAAGRILVGGNHSLEERLCEVFIKFRLEHPRVTLAVRFGASQHMCDLVAAGELSLAVVGTHAKSTNLEVSTLSRWQTPLKVIVPPDHPLADLPSVRPSSLLGYPFVGYALQQQTGIDEYLRQLGVTPNYVMEIESVLGVQRAVAQGVGISLLTAKTMAQQRHLDLVALDLEAPPYTIATYAVHQKNRRLGFAEHVLLEHLTAALSLSGSSAGAV